MKYLSLFFALLFISCASQPVATFTEADDPVALTADEVVEWESVAEGLNGAWASADLRYSRSRVPEVEAIENLPLVAWRGERASA